MLGLKVSTINPVIAGTPLILEQVHVLVTSTPKPETEDRLFTVNKARAILLESLFLEMHALLGVLDRMLLKTQVGLPFDDQWEFKFIRRNVRLRLHTANHETTASSGEDQRVEQTRLPPLSIPTAWNRRHYR